MARKTMARKTKKEPIGAQLIRYCLEHKDEEWQVDTLAEYTFKQVTATTRKSLKNNFAHARMRLEDDEGLLVLPIRQNGKTTAWKFAGPGDEDIITDFMMRKARMNGFARAAARALHLITEKRLLPSEKIRELAESVAEPMDNVRRVVSAARAALPEKTH